MGFMMGKLFCKRPFVGCLCMTQFTMVVSLASLIMLMYMMTESETKLLNAVNIDGRQASSMADLETLT